MHTGTSCKVAENVGGHYWDEETYPDADPWNGENGHTWVSDENGYATGVINTFTLAGLDQEMITGRVLVVHGNNGDRVGCGKYQNEDGACKTSAVDRAFCGASCPEEALTTNAYGATCSATNPGYIEDFGLFGNPSNLNTGSTNVNGTDVMDMVDERGQPYKTKGCQYDEICSFDCELIDHIGEGYEVKIFQLDSGVEIPYIEFYEFEDDEDMTAYAGLVKYGESRELDEYEFIKCTGVGQALGSGNFNGECRALSDVCDCAGGVTSFLDADTRHDCGCVCTGEGCNDSDDSNAAHRRLLFGTDKGKTQGDDEPTVNTCVCYSIL